MVLYWSMSWRGRSLGDDLGLVHHHQAIAELLRLVHVMGRDDERRATLLEPIEAVPEQVARLRVEPRGGLVEDHQVRLVDERARDGEAALHAAGERLYLVLGALVQLHELEQLVRSLARRGPGDVEVSGVHLQVLAHGELGVEVVDLRHHAEARLDLACLRARIHADDAERAVAERAGTRDHAHGAGLPGTVGAEEAERLAGMHVEIDAVDGGELAEPLRQAAGVDKGGGRRHGTGDDSPNLSAMRDACHRQGSSHRNLPSAVSFTAHGRA